MPASTRVNRACGATPLILAVSIKVKTIAADYGGSSAADAAVFRSGQSSAFAKWQRSCTVIAGWMLSVGSP
jgi:hypothetical protein